MLRYHLMLFAAAPLLRYHAPGRYHHDVRLRCNHWRKMMADNFRTMNDQRTPEVTVSVKRILD